MLFIVLHDGIICAMANTFTFLRKDNRADLEINTYKEKIDLLQEKIADYERGMNNLKIYDGTSSVLARIALRDMYDFYDTLEISTDFLVKEGSAVVNESGLVGIIESANKNTAKVRLITGKSNLSVKIGESYGLINGFTKEGQIVVRNINNYANIKEGDEVVTSGLQNIDAGLLVGHVQLTKIDGVEQLVYITPSVDFDNLNYLMVLTK